MRKYVKLTADFDTFQILKLSLKMLKDIPVLKPRFYHLKAYLNVILGRRNKAKKLANKALVLSKKQGNVFECKWLHANLKNWFDRGNFKGKDNNEKWKEHSKNCGEEWNPERVVSKPIMYTLPIMR